MHSYFECIMSIAVDRYVVPECYWQGWLSWWLPRWVSWGFPRWLPWRTGRTWRTIFQQATIWRRRTKQRTSGLSQSGAPFHKHIYIPVVVVIYKQIKKEYLDYTHNFTHLHQLWGASWFSSLVTGMFNYCSKIVNDVKNYTGIVYEHCFAGDLCQRWRWSWARGRTDPGLEQLPTASLYLPSHTFSPTRQFMIT